MKKLRQIAALVRNFGTLRHALSTLAGLYSGDEAFDALGGLTGAETEALCRWAAESGLDVAEIGTLFGMTARELAAALPEGRKVTAVDNFSWNPFGLPPRAHEEFARRILKREIASGRVELRKASALKFLESAGPGVFVFLDGDHRREAVRAEIEAARASGTKFIAGHDWGNPLFGVTEAVRETLGEPDETAGMCWLKRL